MKSETAFVAERAAAQHCPELLRRGPDPVDYTLNLARLGERFARALAPALGGLLGGEAPAVTVQHPREQSEAELSDSAGPLAANCLFASGVPGVTLLVSIGGGGLLGLVDRAFGGSGDPPKVLPETFPLSAELMIDRLEALVAAAMASALGLNDGGEVRPLRRDPRLAELAPFPAGARLATLGCDVAEAGRAEWQLTLALPQTMLPKLLGQGDGPASGSAGPRAADPAAAPFAAVPLPLTATLVDMPVPLAAIAMLEVGSVLPVAVARQVPLAIGGTVVARGSVGAQDDRIALKLTSIA